VFILKSGVEERAKRFLQHYGFDFKTDDRHKVRAILKEEIANFDESEVVNFYDYSVVICSV